MRHPRFREKRREWLWFGSPLDNDKQPFQRQNREFAAAVETAFKKVRLLVGEHYNHFELPETLGNPYGLLGRAALDLMALI
jgi:hypothetical protein